MNKKFDYKGMMRDLVKEGFGGIKTSSLKGKSINEVAQAKSKVIKKKQK